MLKIFIALSVVIIAYSVGFNILSSHKIYKENWSTTITKGFTWFLGEVDFDLIKENTDIDEATFLFYGSRAYFVTFIFLIGIVGLNFLISVAIGETKEISLQSKIYSYRSIAELVYYLEELPEHYLIKKLPNVWKPKMNKQSKSKLKLLESSTLALQCVTIEIRQSPVYVVNWHFLRHPDR